MRVPITMLAIAAVVAAAPVTSPEDGNGLLSAQLTAVLPRRAAAISATLSSSGNSNGGLLDAVRSIAIPRRKPASAGQPHLTRDPMPALQGAQIDGIAIGRTTSLLIG
jgi:hypothetical protein